MPLFGRRDGELVRGESLVRRFMPYLMPTRNESVIYHEEIVDLTRALPYIAAWNARHPRKITVFHLLLAGAARALWARPGLNRFVSGGHIYQRKGVQLSFAAKKQFADSAPIVTIKLDMPENEPFAALVERVYAKIGEGRSDKPQAVDSELKLALALPGFLLRPIFALLRWLDAVNVLPWALLEHDPMYASLFLANLGSLGIDRTWHHLYEYGTISVFGALGVARKHLFVGEDGQPVAREAVSVRYSFDERINDGFYCASSLKLVNEVIEDPEKHLGPP